VWTIKNRPSYNRDKLRYPSDLTDAEWAHIRPLIPRAKRGGGERRVDMREGVNGVMYVLSTGCQWRYISKDLPPRSTVNDYFCLWSYNGTLENIHDVLYINPSLANFLSLPKRIRKSAETGSTGAENSFVVP
jgi:transposase